MMKRRKFAATLLDLQSLATILCILAWMMRLSEMRPEIERHGKLQSKGHNNNNNYDDEESVKNFKISTIKSSNENKMQQISNEPENEEKVKRVKVQSERKSDGKMKGRRKLNPWRWLKFFWPIFFDSIENHRYDNHFNKYRPPTTKRIVDTTISTTTEFIPDDPEDVTDPITPWPKIEPPLDLLNPPVRMAKNARFNNGTLCRAKDESSECWSDGNCHWFEICKTVNCRNSCHRRKGKEWKLAMHDSVGLYPKDI